MSNIKDLTVAQLKRAIEIREEIESLQQQLAAIGGGAKRGRPAKVAVVKTKEKKKRTMSPKGRARIRAALKARWAKAKAAGRNAL